MIKDTTIHCGMLLLKNIKFTLPWVINRLFGSLSSPNYWGPQDPPPPPPHNSPLARVNKQYIREPPHQSWLYMNTPRPWDICQCIFYNNIYPSVSLYNLYLYRSCLYVRRDGMFFIPGLETVYMWGGRYVFHPGFRNCLYVRWDGMFFIPGLETVYMWGGTGCFSSRV